MADLLRIAPQTPNIVPGVRQVPRLGGEYLGAGLDALGQVARYAQEQQDTIDLKKQGVLLDARLDELKEEIKAEPDFSKRDQLYQDRAQEYLDNTLAGIGSSRVRQNLQNYYSMKFPVEALKAKVGTQKEWGEHRVAQTKDLGNLLSDKIVGTDNPADIARYKQMFATQVDQLSIGPFAPLNAVQGQNMRTDFDRSVLTKRAERMIAQSPAQFWAAQDEGQFKDLPLDAQEKLSTKARQREEALDRQADKVAREVKDIVLNHWQVKANNGQITPEEMRGLLNGESAYVKPSEARTLNEVNTNPPTGHSDAVGAIATEYYLSPRTLPHINATRAKLRALQAQLGRPDPRLDKLANELQSDQTTMENQAISREANDIQRQQREIRDLQTSYEAWAEQNPFLKKLTGNMAERDKARIADTYKKQGPEEARKLRDELIKGKEQKKADIETKHNKALKY